MVERAQSYPDISGLRQALDAIHAQCDEMRSLKGWRLNLIRENLAKAKAAIPDDAQTAPELTHDHRVMFMCESCEEHNPEGAVGPRSDIAVMPDGTWLCDSCYSDCEKSAYGLIASDMDDFEFPRFEDLPRPAAYSVPSTEGGSNG